MIVYSSYNDEVGSEMNIRRKRAKTTVKDLKRELGMFGLSTEGKKQDLQDRLASHLQQPSPFDSLPDELVLRIVKAAALRPYCYSYKPADYDHDFIVDVISLISKRFSRIAQDKTVWADTVLTEVGSRPRTDRVINSFLGDDINELVLEKQGFGIKSVISANHIATIAAKCPGLKRLKLFKVRMETWPQLNVPWSLEELTIFDNSSMNICKVDMFKNVRLHRILPQLRTFTLSLRAQLNMDGITLIDAPIWLPDMTGCQDLRQVGILGCGIYKIPDVMSIRCKVPFPRGLRKLTCYGTITNCSRKHMREYMKDWDCQLNFGRQ